jgi:putative FmdB family regulatory protein
VPIYEYRCPNGHTFELFQKMSESPPDACPTCSQGPVEKLLFPVAVHFKGSGFYSTDYGKGSRKKAAKEGESGGGEKAADTSAATPADKPKGDSKPASSSD